MTLPVSITSSEGDSVNYCVPTSARPGDPIERDFAIECLGWLGDLSHVKLHEGVVQAWMHMLRTDGWTNFKVKEASTWCARNVRGFPYYADFVRAHRQEYADDPSPVVAE